MDCIILNQVTLSLSLSFSHLIHQWDQFYWLISLITFFCFSFASCFAQITWEKYYLPSTHALKLWSCMWYFRKCTFCMLRPLRYCKERRMAVCLGLWPCHLLLCCPTFKSKLLMLTLIPMVTQSNSHLHFPPPTECLQPPLSPIPSKCRTFYLPGGYEALMNYAHF